MYHYHQYLLLKPLLYTDHHPYFSKSTNFLAIMPHIQNSFCVNRPTGANVIKKEFCRPFDKDLPDFAISDLDQCVKYLKNWARSRNDGRFDIIVAKKQRGPALEGMFNRVELTCSRAGRYISKSNGKRTGFSKKCNCPWRLSIIQKRIGNEVKWVRGYMHEWPRGFNYEESNSHGGTHVLDRNEVNGSLRRSIPERFDRDIELLIDAAMSPKDIYNFLTRACKKEGLIVSFVMKDVVNRVYKVRQSKTDLVFDMTDLVKCLADKKANNNSIHYAIRVGHENDDCSTDSLFFTMDGSNTLWNLCEGKSILLYDTKHGSNRYGFYLGILSTVDNEGKTRILAISLTKKQDIDTFTWVFEKFKEAFILEPMVMFTDSDAAMIVSIAEVFQATIHLLCIFHIWKNFYSNIMPLLKMSSADVRSRIANKFWRIAKDSDTQMIDEFDNSFDSMSKDILKNGKEGNISQVSTTYCFTICNSFNYLNFYYVIENH